MFMKAQHVLTFNKRNKALKLVLVVFVVDVGKKLGEDKTLGLYLKSFIREYNIKCFCPSVSFAF